MKQEHNTIDLATIARGMAGDYENFILSAVNDHVVRIGLMTTPYFWHFHPNSDETFLVVEGSVWIDLPQESIELKPGQLFTIQAGVPHCTRPGGERSVNITFERAGTETVRCAAPGGHPAE